MFTHPPLFQQCISFSYVISGDRFAAWIWFLKRLESVSVSISVSVIGWLQKVFSNRPPHIIEIRMVTEDLP